MLAKLKTESPSKLRISLETSLTQCQIVKRERFSVFKVQSVKWHVRSYWMSRSAELIWLIRCASWIVLVVSVPMGKFSVKATTLVLLGWSVSALRLLNSGNYTWTFEMQSRNKVRISCLYQSFCLVALGWLTVVICVGGLKRFQQFVEESRV